MELDIGLYFASVASLSAAVALSAQIYKEPFLNLPSQGPVKPLFHLFAPIVTVGLLVVSIIGFIYTKWYYPIVAYLAGGVASALLEGMFKPIGILGVITVLTCITAVCVNGYAFFLQ